MTSRKARQSAIMAIIAAKDIETQDELVSELRRQGHDITQATISRDIKELGLIKTLTVGNKYKYVTKETMDSNISVKLKNVVRESVISVVTANNLVVVKTIGDGASVVSAAVEQMALSETLGVVADKSTILIVCADARDASFVQKKINELL